jgi:hypothetical protein
VKRRVDGCYLSGQGIQVGMHPRADHMGRVQVAAFALLVVVDVLLQCSLGSQHFAGLRGFPLPPGLP